PSPSPINTREHNPKHTQGRITILLSTLNVRQCVIESGNGKWIRHGGKNEPLGCLVRCDGGSSRVGSRGEKDVIVPPVQVTKRTEENVLRNEKLVDAEECFVDFFKIAASRD